MEELFKIAESSSPLRIREIVNFIFKKNVELVNLPQEKIDEYISIIFDFITQNPTIRLERDWDIFRYLLVIMVISLFPAQSNIPSIIINTNSGPLFSILLVLHELRKDHTDLVPQYIQAFYNGLETFNHGFGTRTFYSITHCYYLQALPFILKNNLKPVQFSELLNHFFASIPQVKSEDININFISFTTDMFRQIAYHIMKHNLMDMTTDFAQSFKEMLEICSSCPNIILLNLLHPWYAFYKFTNDQKQQRNLSYNFQEQIEQLTICYERIACGRYHELHRGFPWSIAIYFYGLTQGREQQTRVLLLICNAFRSIPRLEGLRGVPDATKEIHSIMCNQPNNEGLWALFHILTSCESTISLGISDIKKIQGVCIDPKGKENDVKKRTITFSEQAFEEESNTEIDCELSTKIEEIIFNDYESARNCFEKQINLLNQYRTRLITGITFQFVFIETILNDLQNEDNFTSSVAFYYVTKLIRLGIKLMIVSSQRITMLEQFNFNHNLLNQKDPFQPITNSTVLHKIPSFSIICRRYMEFTTRIPKQYYSILAKNIAEMIYKALEKEQISFLFINYFSFLENANFAANENNGCNPNISPQDTLYAHVLCQLMEIVSSNLNDILAHSSSKSKLIFNLVLFIIRIGKPNDSSYCHPCLKLFLKAFYKLILTSIISYIKKASNQIYALKMLKIYLHVIDEEINKGKNVKIRSFQRIYNEIQLFAKKEFLSPLLLTSVPENDAVNVPSLLSLLIASLSCDDVELIKSASDFCLSLFNTENPIDSNNSMILQLFHSWFKSTAKLPNDEVLKIIECLPEYASCFNQPLIPPSKVHSNLIHDESGFDLMEVLNEVAFNMTNDDDEVANLFTLVVDCFDVLKQKIKMKEENLKEPMRKLLLFLCYCSNFDFLNDKVLAFSNDLVNYFVDVFAQGESSLFLIALISISGSSRSESSKYATYLCITFLKKATEKSVSIEIFKETIDEMMSFFNPQMRLLSMLCGLSLFTRFVPDSVSLQVLRCFFISLNEFYIFDVESTTILNKMLKQFLHSRTREQLKEFVYMSYDILSHNLLNCSLVLLKRMRKLEIPLPIQNIDDILGNIDTESSSNSIESMIFFQKLSAVLMCGIEGPIVLNDQMKKLVYKFATSKNDVVNVVELSRKMSLYVSIIRSPGIFKELSSEEIFLKSVLSFFVNTLSHRFQLMRKNAAKAFRFLVTKCDDEFAAAQIEIYCNSPSKIFIFFSPLQDRIAFYRRLTKIVPQKVPCSIVQQFLDSIFEYVDFNDSKKFSFLANLVNFVKFLTIEDFVRLEQVQTIILSPYKEEIGQKTYLEVFIEKILVLYQHREIPYHSIINKYVVRFLLMFPKETVYFIVQIPSKSDSKISYDFLADLIIDDESRVFFSTFVQYIETSKEVLLNYDHPSIFRIIHKLSKIPFFAQLKMFQKLLDGLFFSFIHTAIHTEAFKREKRLFTTIIEIAYSELNTFKISPSIDRLFTFTQLFKLPSMINTHLYHRYVTIIFKKRDQAFISEIVRFIMETKPTITPKVFEILLGHSLKYLDKIDEGILLTLWEFLSAKVEIKQTNLTASILICIIRLLRKNVPETKFLTRITNALQVTISSAETEVVLYSIKLACELAKRELIPPQLYFQIVRQLFSYSKFFDLPYSKYTYIFLKMSHMYEPMPKDIEDSVIETISFFPHDKFNSTREMKRFIDIFTKVPQFLIGLPFSLIAALALYLETNLRQRKPKDDVVDVEPLFVAGLKFCTTVKPSQLEIDRFIESCFKFFGFIVSHQSISEEFPFTFFEYILKNGCSKFPIDLLTEVCSNPSVNGAYLFGFICCASKFVPEEIEKDEYYELVQSCFQYTQDHHSTVNNAYLVALIQFVNSKSELIEKFHPMIFSIVDSWIKESKIDDLIRDRFVIMCNGAVLGSPEDSRHSYLMKIWEFVQTLPLLAQNQATISCLYRFLITSIENLPIHHQLAYLNFMLDNASSNPQYSSFFISVLPILLDSDHIENKVKSRLLASLSNLFTKVSVVSFENVIESVEKFGKKCQINVDFSVVSILLSQCKFCSHANRLVYIRRIMERIHEIEFGQFITEIPLIFWSDDFLPITVSLITPDEWPIWCSIFAFSHRLTKISDHLASSSFLKHVNEENYSQVVTFFNRILTEKPHFMYSKVCSALLQCMHVKGMQLNTTVVEQAIKHNDCQIYLPEFLNETIPSPHFLMPNLLNDSIFAHFLNSMPEREAAAVSLTFLSEYQAADSIYGSAFWPNHPLFEAVLAVNSHFATIFSGEQSIGSFLGPLCPLGQESDVVLIKVEDSVKSVMWKEVERSLSNLFEAEKLNAHLLQKKRNLSLFEKERIAAIEQCIRIIRRHAHSLKTSSPPLEFVKSVSPVFTHLLTSIDRYLDGSPQIQVPAVVNDGNGAVLLDPSLAGDFTCVSMLTSRNLLVVSKPQIDSYLVTMSLQISENQVTAADWCKFAHFCFNVFLAQPSFDLFQVTFNVYAQIIGLSRSNELEARPFIRVEAPARIITLVRVAIESPNAEMAMVVTSNASIFTVEFAEIWRPWIIQIIDLARSNWFCSLVSEIAKEAKYRSALYSEKIGCKRIAEVLDPKFDSTQPLDTMLALQNEFDHVFALDFEKLYKEVVRGNKDEALKFRESGRCPSSFIEFAALQVDEDEDEDEMESEDGLFSAYSAADHVLSEREKMSQIVLRINGLLPLTMPESSTFYKVYDELRLISPDLVMFFAMTSNSAKETFLIQRSTRKSGFSTTIITLSNILSVFKKLFDSCYQSRIRSVNLGLSPLFEVGHSYLVVQLGEFNSCFFLSTIFAFKIKMTHKKWISLKMEHSKEEDEDWPFGAPQFTVAQSSSSSSFESKLSDTAVLEFFSAITPLKEFVTFRRLLNVSLASNASVRYIFNAPYPSIDRTSLNLSGLSAPVLIGDFEERFLSFFNESTRQIESFEEIRAGESSFRLSPNIMTLLGPRYQGEFLLSFAAAMKAIASRIEIFRACLEIIIADPQYTEDGGAITPSSILSSRNRLEEKLIEASPPTGTMVSDEDCVNWFSGLMELIKKSENPEIQNPYAVPWF